MRYIIAILFIIAVALFLFYAYDLYQETTRLKLTPDYLKELYNVKKELKKPLNEPLIEYESGKG